MVTLFFKWWLVPALGLGLVLNTDIKTSATSETYLKLHPIHISTVEIEHDAADKNQSD